MGDSNRPYEETTDDVIELSAVTTADGSEVFVAKERRMLPATDLSVRPGGIISATNPQSVDEPLSVLPTDRMAASEPGLSWAQIAENLRRAETGQSTGTDLTLRPGGVVDVLKDGQTNERHSVLPTDRMAAKPSITIEDARIVMRIDPDNVERWEPARTDVLDGWKFRLRPLSEDQEFTFLAFRSPTDSGGWRLWVLRPDADTFAGHKDHMVSTVVSGQRIPVICGPSGNPARTLEEARLHAAKWAIYTLRRLRGEPVIFSV